jgi:ADP-L-glycero-D-manno-heptose 6-epimerase
MDNLAIGKILVTGAAGFIRSALVAELNDRGHGNIIASGHLGQDERFLNLVGVRFEECIYASDLLRILGEGNRLDLSCIFRLGACAKTTEQGYNLRESINLSLGEL